MRKDHKRKTCPAPYSPHHECSCDIQAYKGLRKIKFCGRTRDFSGDLPKWQDAPSPEYPRALLHLH